ncbi:MAG: hypothetical protein JW855_01365 [Gammaproteobacteria bacterium]|nr:hypothetical protein [Gammaproteobacteria bacterium]
MKKIHLITLSIIFLFGSLFSALAYAMPLADITTLIAFPPQIFVNTTAFAQYQIKNNVDGVLPIQISYPTGLAKAGGSTCGDSLAQGATCLLNLEFTPTAIPQVIDGKLSVKFQDGSGVYTNINTQSANTIPGAPNLSVVGSSDIVLIPATEETITVKNQSTTTAANNVQMNLPDNIASEVESVTSCPSIAPNATCDIKITPKASAAKVDQLDTTIQGSNTLPAYITVAITDRVLHYASPSDYLIYFDQPYTLNAPKKKLKAAKDVSFTNNSAKTVQINSVVWPSTQVPGVGLPTTIPAPCQSLAQGASCDLSFTANQAAYDKGMAQVHYTLDGVGRTQPVNLQVAQTSVKINDNKPVILPREDATQYTIPIKNEGYFDWQSPTFSLGGSLTGVTLGTNDCSDLHPGDTCHLTFNLSSNLNPGETGSLEVGGLNINPVSHALVTVTGSLTVAPYTTEQHLGYRAVELINNYSDSKKVDIGDINLSTNLTDKVSICPKTGSSCDYHSTCLTGDTLANGGSCEIWLKAKDHDNSSLGVTPGSVTINYSLVTLPSGKLTSTSKSLVVDYSQDLYVGGFFTTAGGSSADYIAKWDGSNWAALGPVANPGMDAAVRALSVHKGDLYAGGFFNNAGGILANYVAKWDGNNWSSINSVNNYVLALTSHSDGNLYAGGMFTDVANRIAAWDGSNWSVLGSPINGVNERVYALTELGSNLYVGGVFTSAGGSSANYIAAWDGSNWSVLGSPTDGVDNNVRALTDYNSDLYVGGDFVNAGGSAANHMATWDGSNWSVLGSPTDGVNNAVRALNSYSSNLYVGGDFTTAGGNTANHVAQWNGSAWSSIGTGLNNGVDDLVHALTSHNNNLYVAGDFGKAGCVNPANYIAMWDGLNWFALGSGLNNDARAVLVAPSLVLSTSP